MSIKSFILLDFNGVIAKSFSLIEGMSEVIKELSQHNSLGIISSDTSYEIIDFLHDNNLSNYFVEVLGSDSSGNKTAKIKLIFQTYQLEPTDCIFITDTLSDLREAHETLVKTIAVTWGLHTVETLHKGNPDQIVTSPQELLSIIHQIQS